MHPFARIAVASVLALAACGGDGDEGGAAGGAGAGSGGGGSEPTSAIARIAGGRYHTCVLRHDGAIYCYGQGAYRQLGGDYGAQSTARRVDSISDATSIDCGDRFTCALRPGGAVWCWGDDDHGQSGTAETTPCGDAAIDSVCITTPQPVAGLETGVAELALGADHACVRRTEGDVLCWGDNAHGQVGQSALVDVAAPTAVPGVSGAAQVVAGDTHTCALLGSPGTVVCWGRNGNAQLGNGTTTDASSPSTVGGLDDAVEIALGGEHSCARRANGAVVCWGYNYLGQLGNGSTSPTRATSIQAVVSLDDAVQLTAGRYHTCARRAGGALACWGHNDNGQIGDGTTGQRTAPTQVVDLDDATWVAAGSWATCAAVGPGTVFCWGDDLGGQLGDGRVTSEPNPTPIPSQGLP